jgi:hypothetical protein
MVQDVCYFSHLHTRRRENLITLKKIDPSLERKMSVEDRKQIVTGATVHTSCRSTVVAARQLACRASTQVLRDVRTSGPYFFLAGHFFGPFL